MASAVWHFLLFNFAAGRTIIHFWWNSCMFLCKSSNAYSCLSLKARAEAASKKALPGLQVHTDHSSSGKSLCLGQHQKGWQRAKAPKGTRQRSEVRPDKWLVMASWDYTDYSCTPLPESPRFIVNSFRVQLFALSFQRSVLKF